MPFRQGNMRNKCLKYIKSEKGTHDIDLYAFKMVDIRLLALNPWQRMACHRS